MSRFSIKYGYDEKIGQEVIQDFPEWTRIGLIQILKDFLFIDMDPRYKNNEDKPLGIKSIHEKFSKITRNQMGQDEYDSQYCQDSLFEHLKRATWYYIFDFIELVSRELKYNEKNYFFDDEKLRLYGFKSFKRKINDLFKEDNFVWRLSDKGNISRKIPEILVKNLEETENQLTGNFEPAREHYKKSFKYIFSFPLDLENGIKEIVSAIESVGRTLYPNASTLGHVIKELKKEQLIPKLLVDIIDRVYVFANATPAVRHGSKEHSYLKSEDAEFTFYTGVSLIKYLMKIDEIRTSSNTKKTHKVYE